MNLLLSYPRSGNTWVRYCVEYLTKKPTIGYTIPGSASWDFKCLGSFVDLGVDLDAENILFKRHFLNYLHEDVDKLIFIVRNYKECIVRHQFTNHKNKGKLFNVNIMIESNYVDIINYYDEFSGNKIIIYYEDLITNIQPILEKILSLLDYNDTHLKSFMKDLDKHIAQSLNLYGNSSTQGKKILYHSYTLGKEAKLWDEYLIKNHEKLFTKYLERYAE